MLCLQPDMVRSRAVTTLARDANNQALPVVSICTRIAGKRSNKCRVAFQASRIYDAGKVRCPVKVARAVDPPVSIRPITHWQFEEPVSLPVQVGLAPYSGSGHEVDALGSLKDVRFPSAPRRLEKSVLPCLHDKLQPWPVRLRRINNRQRIRILSKRPEHRSGCGNL